MNFFFVPKFQRINNESIFTLVKIPFEPKTAYNIINFLIISSKLLPKKLLGNYGPIKSSSIFVIKRSFNMLLASIHTSCVCLHVGGCLSEYTVRTVCCLPVRTPASSTCVAASESGRKPSAKQRTCVPYLHTSYRWPHPDWRTPTPAAGRDSRRSSCWPRWTRSSLPLHSRRVSRQSILGLLQSTPPSPVLTRPWSCNNWFFAPTPTHASLLLIWFERAIKQHSIAWQGYGGVQYLE